MRSFRAALFGFSDAVSSLSPADFPAGESQPQPMRHSQRACPISRATPCRLDANAFRFGALAAWLAVSSLAFSRMARNCFPAVRSTVSPVEIRRVRNCAGSRRRRECPLRGSVAR